MQAQKGQALSSSVRIQVLNKPMSILNIFGSTGLAPKNGPPLASPFSTAGGGVRFGEPGRSWCGLPRQPERINLDRVGIQRILQHGRNEKGELVGVIFLAPEFVSHRRAEYLVSVNMARFCGFGGEGE
jgi:hypothetical protein